MPHEGTTELDQLKAAGWDIGGSPDDSAGAGAGADGAAGGDAAAQAAAAAAAAAASGNGAGGEGGEGHAADNGQGSGADAGAGGAGSEGGEGGSAAGSGAGAGEGGEGGKGGGGTTKSPEDQLNDILDIGKIPSGFGEAPKKTTPPFNAKEVLGVEASLEQIIEAVTKYPELKEQIASGRGSQANPFFSEQTKAFDDYVRGGGDPATFARVQALKPDEMSPTDKIVYQMMYEKGLSYDEAKTLVTDKYGLDVQSPEENALQEEKDAYTKRKNLNDIRLKADAKDADTYLRGVIKEAMKPQVAPTIDENAVRSRWDGALSKIVEPMKKLNLGGMVYEADGFDEFRQELFNSLIGGMTLAGNNEASPENLEQLNNVTEMAKGLFWSRYGEHVAKSALVHGVKLGFKMKHNPTPPGSSAQTQQQPVGAEAAAGQDDEREGVSLADWIKSGKN